MFSIQSSLAIIVPAIASICTILLLRKKKKPVDGQEENLKVSSEETDLLTMEEIDNTLLIKNISHVINDSTLNISNKNDDNKSEDNFITKTDNFITQIPNSETHDNISPINLECLLSKKDNDDLKDMVSNLISVEEINKDMSFTKDENKIKETDSTELNIVVDKTKLLSYTEFVPCLHNTTNIKEPILQKNINVNNALLNIETHLQSSNIEETKDYLPNQINENLSFAKDENKIIETDSTELNIVVDKTKLLSYTEFVPCLHNTIKEPILQKNINVNNALLNIETQLLPCNNEAAKDYLLNEITEVGNEIADVTSNSLMSSSQIKSFDDIDTSFIDEDEEDYFTIKIETNVSRYVPEPILQPPVLAEQYWNTQEEHMFSMIHPCYYANASSQHNFNAYNSCLSMSPLMQRHNMESGYFSLNQVPNWADEVENWIDESHRDDVFAADNNYVEELKENSIQEQHLEPDTEQVVDITSDLSDSGQGSASSHCLNSPNHLIIVYYFEFPTNLCGMLIGRHGQHINMMSKESGTDIIIIPNDDSKDMQIVSVTGSVSAVHKAIELMKGRFPADKFPEINFEEISIVDDVEPTKLIQQVQLPEKEMIEAIVTNVVNVNHLYVQLGGPQMTIMLEELHTQLKLCYSSLSINTHLELNRPVDVNTVCVTPMMDGWFRGIVLEHDLSVDECLIRLLDYGGLLRIKASHLRRIRRDFLTIPFQAIECYLADCFPPTMTGFPDYAVAMMERVVDGNLYNVLHTQQTINGVPVIKLLEAPDFEGGPYVSILRRMASCGLCMKLECLPQYAAI